MSLYSRICTSAAGINGRSAVRRVFCRLTHASVVIQKHALPAAGAVDPPVGGQQTKVAAAAVQVPTGGQLTCDNNRAH